MYGFRIRRKFKKTNVTTFETNRLRADLLEVIKITHGLDGVGEEIFFTRAGIKARNIIRSHLLKLFKKRFNQILPNFFLKTE